MVLDLDLVVASVPLQFFWLSTTFDLVTVHEGVLERGSRFYDTYSDYSYYVVSIFREQS